MAGSNFIDHVKICARSGAGGPGVVSFRREKHVPKGGPDGGNGGRGGHIILHCTTNVWTLIHLRYRKHVIASPGGRGEGGKRSGSQGEDVYLEVPPGTIAKNAETQEVLFEITEEGQEVILAAGEEEVLVTKILKLQPTKHQDIHNLVKREPKIGLFLN